MNNGNSALPNGLGEHACRFPSREGYRGAGIRAKLVMGCLLAALSFGSSADPSAGRTALERYHAEQSRELKREQRQFFQGVEKELPRLQERELKRHLEQQVIRQRQLQERQRREQAALQQRLRVLPDHKARRLGTQQLKRFRLEQERQQFQFRMEQRGWVRGH